jgi:hypothetical protein
MSKMAGEEGFEPSTHGLTVRCSNQLSYTPKMKVLIYNGLA